MKNPININDQLRDELADLKSYLPEGWVKTAATRLNVSESTVRHAANGRFNNKRVMLALISMAKKERETINAVLKA